MNHDTLPVGLDFGTTNSLISYWDEATRTPVPYLPEGSDFAGVPSAIAPTSEDNEGKVKRLIGKLALSVSGVARHFKLSLGDFRGNETQAYRAAHDYLQQLFADFSPSSQAGLGPLVVSVPENWANDRKTGGTDALRRIFRQLNKPEPQFVSEPLAAACYYAHLGARDQGGPIRRNVLIYDHGGGTLDLSLCSIDGNHIETIHAAGIDREMSDLGFGGAAFDRGVLESLKTRHPALKRLNAEETGRWLIDFEEKKRQYGIRIKEQCESPHWNQYKAAKIFEVAGTEVLLGDLIGVFERNFAMSIQTMLDQFLKEARQKRPSLNIRDPDRFRVVPVGGFSEFFPIQRMLEFYFKHADVSGTGAVVDRLLPRDDRWQAVSKGACLIASRTMTVNVYPPFVFGICSFVDGRLEERRHNPLILKDKPLAEHAEPYWLDRDFGLAEFDPNEGTGIEFYVERGDKRKYYGLTKQGIESYLPSFKAVSEWRFGSLVEDGKVFVIIHAMRHGKPYGRPKRIRLGEFFKLSDGAFDAVTLDG